MGSPSSLGEDYVAALRYAFLPIVAALTVLASQVCEVCACCVYIHSTRDATALYSPDSYVELVWLCASAHAFTRGCTRPPAAGSRTTSASCGRFRSRNRGGDGDHNGSEGEEDGSDGGDGGIGDGGIGDGGIGGVGGGGDDGGGGDGGGGGGGGGGDGDGGGSAACQQPPASQVCLT